MPSEMSEKTVDTLLDKLSTDDDFREAFKKDPRGALASIGHEPSSEKKVQDGIWSCLKVTSLADKKTISDSRDVLRKQLLSAQAAAHPISLETSRS